MEDTEKLKQLLENSMRNSASRTEMQTSVENLNYQIKSITETVHSNVLSLLSKQEKLYDDLKNFQRDVILEKLRDIERLGKDIESLDNTNKIEELKSKTKDIENLLNNIGEKLNFNVLLSDIKEILHEFDSSQTEQINKVIKENKYELPEDMLKILTNIKETIEDKNSEEEFERKKQLEELKIDHNTNLQKSEHEHQKQMTKIKIIYSLISAIGGGALGALIKTIF